MYQSIHNVKEIVRGELREINDSYAMTITIKYEDSGYCKQRRGDLTIHGWMELETQLTLFADTKEALEIKASVLTTEEA